IGPLVQGTDGSIWFDQVAVEEDGVTPEPNTHRIGKIGTTGAITKSIPPDLAAGATAFAQVAVSPSGNLTVSPNFIPNLSPQAATVEVHAFSEFTPVSSPNVASVAHTDSYAVVTGNTLSVTRPGVLANDT